MTNFIAALSGSGPGASRQFGRGPDWRMVALVVAGILGISLLVFPMGAFAADLPGTDRSGDLEAAGTLLRIIDTALFRWGARLFSGLALVSGAWSLKEQKYGLCVLSVISALVFALAPTLVKNVFTVGGGGTIFS